MSEQEVSEIQSNHEQENLNIDSQEEAIDYKSLYEETKSKLETVAKHKDKLYQETKQAKADRDEVLNKIKQSENEQALKNQEFEKLWKSSTEEKKLLEEKLNSIMISNKSEKIQIAALKLSSELADGDNVELLSEFVQRSLANLADEAGLLSDDVLESVKQDFKSNAKFKSLLKGSKAVGGGAPGNKSNASESTLIKRDAFEKLDLYQKGKFMKAGGKIID